MDRVRDVRIATARHALNGAARSALAPERANCNSSGAMDADLDLGSLPSPALVVDLEAFDANVAAADAMLAGSSKSLRPHVKTHRTPALALRQLRGAAAAGLTCATVGEAEAFVDAGVLDVLIANEVVERGKLDRVAALGARAMLAVAVDAEAPVLGLGAAAVRAGSTIDVLVDVDVGLERCGVPDANAAVALATFVERTKGLRLRGLMGYEGRQRADATDRTATIARAYELLAETKAAFERAGLPVGTVSSAGTSTLPEVLGDPTVTEIQAGTYPLMESNLDGLDLPFAPALSVVAAVISRTGPRVVLDVGRKSIASDYGPPVPLRGDLRVVAFHEEHTILLRDGDDGDEGGAGGGNPGPPRPGERVRLRPEHVRLTFNLHDVVWLARADGTFEPVPVAARGRSA